MIQLLQADLKCLTTLYIIMIIHRYYLYIVPMLQGTRNCLIIPKCAYIYELYYTTI